MSTAVLEKEAKALIDTMSGAQLRVASEFLAFVKDRRADAATLELLTILQRTSISGHLTSPLPD